jgi:nicotinamide-nucleotide amidase
VTNDDTIDRLADDIRRLALDGGLTVAVAESLTGGALSQALARAGDAGVWFAGGVVAYRNTTKHRVLGVPEGAVITPEAARAMAAGVLEALGTDVAVAVTGVGGPGSEEGRPAGTVFIGLATADAVRHVAYRFDGDPAAVVASTVEHALRHLREALHVGRISPAATPIVR